MNSKRDLRWVTCGLSFVLLCAGCGSPIIHTESTRTAAEALFTAVTSRQVALLDANERRISERVTAGELSEQSAVWLRARIAEARNGQWQTAAEKLNAALQSSD